MVVAVSKSFKKMTVRAILSIFLFVIVYITLILLAIGLTFLCVLGSYYLIKAKPTFYTLMIGVGLVSLGVFILAFLFKFLLFFFQFHINLPKMIFKKIQLEH